MTPQTVLPNSRQSVRPLVLCDKCQRKSEPERVLMQGGRMLCWACWRGRK